MVAAGLPSGEQRHDRPAVATGMELGVQSALGPPDLEEAHRRVVRRRVGAVEHEATGSATLGSRVTCTACLSRRISDSLLGAELPCLNPTTWRASPLGSRLSGAC